MTEAAAGGGAPDLTAHWAGIASLAIFAAAYLAVIAEELIHLRKSAPVIVAAALLWIIASAVELGLGRAGLAGAALRRVLLDYAELLLFLVAAITYVNTLEERRVFAALRARLVRAGFGYRALFWLTGGLAFAISPVADNLTTALVMCTVAIAAGRAAPRFVALACINIVVAANAGGAFSPFGDITTLMVWQHGAVPFLQFFRLFPPALASWAVPAALMHAAVPRGAPDAGGEAVAMKPGARRIVLLFGATLALAVAVHAVLHQPPALGMMTGLGFLQLFDYYLQRKDRRRGGARAVNVLQRLAGVEWDTLLFFYGVMLCVAALGLFGYLALAADFLYGGPGQTAANVAIGVVSAILDNIPLMFAVLSMHPDMSLGQWLLVTLTAGIGGSLLSIGSAAGIAVMGQARGVYTFAAHLRWTPAIAAGYAAGILAHLALNRGLF